MEIKSIPEIIKEMDSLLKEEKYDEAYQFAKENINLNKEYIEGEYTFKNLLEEILFQISINKEIKRKYPLILDYSSLYANYGEVLLHFNENDDAMKSFQLSHNYNPVNVNSIFGLCELYRKDNNWNEYYNLTIQSFKYSYYPEDLAKSFRNLSIYYLNEFEDSSNDEDIKLTFCLNRLSEIYDDNSNRAINELNEFKDEVSKLNLKDQFDEYCKMDIEDVRDYLKSKGLPYSASVEVITICKNLGFQLDEDKKVVPALFYFNIAYDLTKDPAIKDVIDDLNLKVERKLNE